MSIVSDSIRFFLLRIPGKCHLPLKVSSICRDTILPPFSVNSHDIICRNGSWSPNPRKTKQVERKPSRNGTGWSKATPTISSTKLRLSRKKRDKNPLSLYKMYKNRKLSSKNLCIWIFMYIFAPEFALGHFILLKIQFINTPKRG